MFPGQIRVGEKIRKGKKPNKGAMEVTVQMQHGLKRGPWGLPSLGAEECEVCVLPQGYALVKGHQGVVGLL